MKLNNIIYPVVACSLLLSSCYDQKMEWKRPDEYGAVSLSEMPLELAEKIANYDYIKAYAEKYMPNSTIGLGLGADIYIEDEAYQNVANNNFQMFTTGNAMKHSSVVKSNGTLDFTTIDKFLAAVPSDIQIYGHNFLWHTQQNQTYLKSLIAPEMQIEVDQSDVCANIISNSDFEDGTSTGWFGWSKYSSSVDSPGHDSEYAWHAVCTSETSSNWDCQLWWATNLVVGETYAYSFYAKSDCNLTVQFIGQNDSYQGLYKDSFTAGSTWTYCTGEFTYTESDNADICRIGIQFGGTPDANLWIDDFKFGLKVDNSGPYNYCTNGDFSNGTDGWTLNNVSGGITTESISDNPSGNKYVLKMVANESVENSWDLQIASPEMPTLSGKKVEISFYVKSDQAGHGRLSFSSALSNRWPWMNWTGTQSSWTSSFETSTSWTPIDVIIQNFSTDFVEGESVWQFYMEFGYDPGVTYYIDNVKVTEVEETASEVKRSKTAQTRGGITYILKSAEEKRTALLGAMEEWIKGMYEHLDGRVLNYDVVNEPIADNLNWRGVDGNFMDDDVAPVESTESGLSLNWDSDHFYWGYYIGKDYAVKAFEFARKYAPANSNLFVNDYGLESNPNKTAALVEFVKYIDNNGQKVDGIGTQMHVSTSITKAEVDAMFQTLAATGKLVRVTELDVTLGTATPSTDELASQAETYQMIIESYKENVPESQQSGITIWSLTDHKREHEYWLPDCSPNIFDANYGRKHAYKGVCDAIAGYDISTDFDGTYWNK